MGRTSLLLTFLGLFHLVHVNGQVNHWETVAYDTSYWRYVIPVSPVPQDWTSVAFNDSTWNIDRGGFGYGDGDDSTIVSGNSVFIRHAFNVASTQELEAMYFAMDYDDGFVAYLNGVEVARANVGAVGDTVAFNQFASAQHEAILYSGGVPDLIDVDPQILQSGINVLAVQVHNRSAGSSDLTCRPFLFAGIGSQSVYYGENPTWFDPPIVFSSHLPIVVLNTNGQVIPDDPRIVIEMGIIDNGPADLNYLTDPFNGYNGLVNIERRGSSSQGFPKKQYAMETQDTIGNSLDVSLLGLPIENDWILHAPYSDKSLMRNYLTYNWWRDMGWYTTRTKYCEVILNGDYQGVYILMEQIKWDNDRVDVEKLDGNDIQGDSLTGGYIFKVDKITSSGQYDWTSHIDTFQGQPKITRFQYDYPNRDIIIPEQEAYLQQFVHDWEQSLIDSTFMDPEIGYRKYVDVNSFIDYFLIQEITKNVDGYRLSTYLNKQRDSRGGKLQAGPAWDFNITLGNANYCEGGLTENYALDFPCNQSIIPFWWHRMNQDSVYWHQVKCRWLELRSDLLSWPSIEAQIDSNVMLLGDAVTRNFERWDILNTYVWPNNNVGGTYEAEIDYLKQWLQLRLFWMDSAIGFPTDFCSSPYSGDVLISEINYHSSDTLDTEDWFELRNMSSDTIDLSFWVVYDKNEFNTFTLPMGTYLLPDSFMVVSRNSDLFESFNPDVSNHVGPFNWGIGNGGDRISVRDGYNDLVVTVEFDDTAPWPTAADGNSQTLEFWDWATDQNDPANWHDGCPGGSPGRSFTYCVYASVDDEHPSDQFKIYPNPANAMVWIQSESAVTLSIWDITGKQLMAANAEAGRTQFDISMFRSGVYLVRTEYADGTIRTERLVVN